MKMVSSGNFSDINKKSEIGNGTVIGNFSSIKDKVYIGELCFIGDYCILGHPSKKKIIGKDVTLNSAKIKDFINDESLAIGKNSIIRSHSVIYTNIKIGEDFKTGHHVLIREHSSIGRNVTIGSNTIIDGYIKIGDNSQIQSNSYITQSVSIGKGVFIAPCTSFYDNKKIVLKVFEDLDGAKIDDYVRIGGGSIILPGVKIGKFSMIGAGSVVTKSIPSGYLAYGNPAKIIRKLSNGETKKYVSSLSK